MHKATRCCGRFFLFGTCLGTGPFFVREGRDRDQDRDRHATELEDARSARKRPNKVLSFR